MIDGPQSLLTQSSRYGLQMAMILPILPLFHGKWSMMRPCCGEKNVKVRKACGYLI